jgi:methionyl aminopeptidase
LILLKDKYQVRSIDYACKIVRDTLFLVEEKIVPGITTLDLDRIAEEFIVSKGAIPGFKGLYGFPGTLCVSIEDEVVHGIPSDRQLIEGQIISVDVGSIYEDYYGDQTQTFAVGNINEKRKSIIDITKQSLMLGIDQVFAVKYIGDIGHALLNLLQQKNYFFQPKFELHNLYHQYTCLQRLDQYPTLNFA